MREAIDRLIETGEMEGLIEALGSARSSEVRRAVSRLVDTDGRPGAGVEQARDWCARPEPVARHVACGLLARGYADAPGEAKALLLGLADDAEWPVREAAGHACGAILREDAGFGAELLREWCGHPSPNVRRTVLTAVARTAQTRRLEWREPLLKLVEPLLSDRDPAVRRAMGPLVLGSVLLKAYPDMTFEYLVKWSTSSDEQTLWNVAMAFSSAGAPPIAKKALIVLRKLSLDERRYVWRAVASAMWKLGRKKPEVIRPELSRWLEDERRVSVAREALRHL
jgi:HEAT repeat protein